MSDYPAGTVLGAWPVTIGGLELDRVDEYGVEWNLTSFTGWGTASTSGEVNDRPGTRGGSAPDWEFKPKEMTLAGSVDAESPLDRREAERRLTAAIQRTDTLMVIHDELPRQTMVRLNGKVEITRTSTHTFDFEASVLALDPYWYSAELLTASTAFPSSVGGMSWPAVWPAMWDAAVTSGEMNMLNAGNETAWPVYRIDGPVTDPVITDATTGNAMRFTIVLGVGEWLTIDTDNHRVLGNGEESATRRSTFRGDWLGLPPGPSTVRFSGVDGAGSNLSAAWRHTDI